jgi:hypothetical protein
MVIMTEEMRGVKEMRKMRGRSVEMEGRKAMR